MDTPIGTCIKEGMNTNNVDFHKLFQTLKRHELTGYMAIDILTNNGIEEGILLYKGGDPIAAEYTYVHGGRVFHGENALKYFMNACMGDGKFDVYELTENEVVEAREKNREDVFKYKLTEKEISELLPDSFQEQKFEEKRVGISAETVKNFGGLTKEEVLKKYGISRPDERMIDKLLKDIEGGIV